MVSLSWSLCLQRSTETFNRRKCKIPYGSMMPSNVDISDNGVTVVTITAAAAALRKDSGGRGIESVSNLMGPPRPEDLTTHPRNHTIIVEEVDKNGKSVVKAFELPDYDVSREAEGGGSGTNSSGNSGGRQREQTGQGRDAADEESSPRSREADMAEVRDTRDSDYAYGCDDTDGKRRRKCLQKRKRLLRRTYRNWKEVIRRVIKDLDRKIKNLRGNCVKDIRNDHLNISSEFSVANLKRKKP